ncbi:MAG TPA: L-arabinonate dehydratase, partial [Rubrivivax sp.]|nr:L-arabinonate dehydratase [Rubrivivax sp.]
MTRNPADLRSARWFAPDDFRSFGHRSRVMQMGYAPTDWVGKPVIAIVNTWSDANQCHAHFKQRVEDVKRGVFQAGGFPLELPAISLSESMVKPTTMLYRNFLAMETEELLRSHPVDGAVLMGGCDKTTPGLLMGALSMGLPCIYLPAGPMLRGNWKGQVLGSGSDAFKYWDERRAGRLSDEAWQEMEAGIARSHGTCMTMGTAATMMGIAEAIGFTLPGASSIPAPDANHIRMAAECGRRIVQMVWDDLTPATMLSRANFDNAIAVAMAMGCSTNAIIHLVAISRRAGHPVTLDDFDGASRKVPVIANIRPSGDTYLMEDFFYAGGLPALMNRLAGRGHLQLDAMTVNGRTLGDNIAGAEVYNDDVIRAMDRPIYAEGALAVLRGNLAPDGVIIKPSAVAPHLLQHTGPALVFDDYPSLKKAVDDPELDVTAEHVLVLRYAGPKGAGMPEWGMLPIPTKLLKEGVKDMLRLSDARMSGTSYGGCLLHCCPEAHVGGPLAL